MRGKERARGRGWWGEGEEQNQGEKRRKTEQVVLQRFPREHVTSLSFSSPSSGGRKDHIDDYSARQPWGWGIPFVNGPVSSGSFLCSLLFPSRDLPFYEYYQPPVSSLFTYFAPQGALPRRSTSASTFMKTISTGIEVRK